MIRVIISDLVVDDWDGDRIQRIMSNIKKTISETINLHGSGFLSDNVQFSCYRNKIISTDEVIPHIL